MKYILIILIIAAYSGFSISLLSRPIELTDIVGTVLLISLGIFSSRYLYEKENKNKIEWALFGLLGNIGALMIYSTYKQFTNAWKKGKTVTRNN